MSDAGSLTLRIEQLKSPDVSLRDEAARAIWQRFSIPLRALVRRRLDARIRRREDEDDVLQCMYTSFCVGQREGRAAPASREELWRLLVRITNCKLINAANRHTAARRDVRKEHPTDSDCRRQGSIGTSLVLDGFDQRAPSPEKSLIMAEELDLILRNLPEDLRGIVHWKLEGYTNAEIAGFIGRTVRMVELKLQMVRKRLQARSATTVEFVDDAAG